MVGLREETQSLGFISRAPSLTHSMANLDLRLVALILASLAVIHGTYFSLKHNTFLDTSNPLLTTQPHPLANTHTFASKRSPLNLIFLKWSWAWSTLAFLVLQVPRRPTRRLFQWALATAAWYACAVSFLSGPGLLARLAMASGAVCGIHIDGVPPVAHHFAPIPISFCAEGLSVSRAEHPELFPLDMTTDHPRTFVPRLRSGHDVSGHVFLLTLAVLFLADQLRQTRFVAYGYARVAVCALLALWVFSLWITSVYFHSPAEKISGFCTLVFSPSLQTKNILTSFAVIGLACFAFSQLPLWF